MKSVLQFFKSVRLAVTLILIIVVFSVLSTLVPQGKPDDYYHQAYNPLVADLIVGTGLKAYNHSVLFLVPMVLFLLNLGVCSVDRLVTRARTKAAKRFGPDLIHLSLLILGVGGIVTASVRQEQFFNMGEGDAVALSDGYHMTLKSFEAEKYESGRPKAWISTVDVTKDNQPVLTGYRIEVNHPLSLGLLNVYQSSFGNESSLKLRDPDGKETSMAAGQSLSQGDTELYFAGTRETDSGTVALIEEWKGQNKTATREEGPGDLVGPYKIAAVAERPVTGLTAVNDPGFIPVLVSLVIGMVGLGLTAFQKRGEGI